MTNSLIPQCVITGCYVFDGDSHMYGDLHAVGDVYILNAVLNREGEAVRNYEDLPHPGAKIVNCELAFLFERRGVVIFAKEHATLNQAAKDYLHV